MNCKTISSAAWEYLEGSLSPSEKDAFEDHLSLCTNCRQLISELSKIESVINESKKTTIDPYLATRIIGRIETELHQRELPRYFRPILFLRPVMIVVAVLIGTAAGIYVASGRQPLQSKAIAQQQELMSLQSELFISDLLDEDKSLFENHTP